MEHSFLRYVRDLAVSWWGAGGALSLIGFFVPPLATYRPFIVAVAVLAFIAAGYHLHRRQAAAHDERAKQLADERERALRAERAHVVALEAELAAARRPKFSEETRTIAEAAYAKLSREERIALRYLMVAGDMTDRKALDYLHTKGMALNYGGIFSQLSQTPFVERVLQGRQPGEGISGYTGNYTISPMFREVLVPLLQGDPQAQ